MVGREVDVVGQGLGLCRMHVCTFASAMPSVTRTTAFDGMLSLHLDYL